MRLQSQALNQIAILTGLISKVTVWVLHGSNDAHSGITVGAHDGIGKWRTAVHLRGFGVRAPTKSQVAYQWSPSAWHATPCH